MPDKPIVIFGTNTLSANALAFYRSEGLGEVAAFTVDRARMDADTFYGLPVVAYEDLSEKHPPDGFEIFVTVGYSDLNRHRERIMDRVRGDGYALASCISRRTNILAEAIGENAFIFPGCTIDPYVTVGRGVLISSNAYIAHYCSIGDYCFIAGGATIGGTTSIGHHSIVGCNATVGPNVDLGAYNFLGDGVLVRQSSQEGSVFIPEQTPKGPMSAERVKVMLLRPLSERASGRKDEA